MTFVPEDAFQKIAVFAGPPGASCAARRGRTTRHTRRSMGMGMGAPVFAKRPSVPATAGTRGKLGKLIFAPCSSLIRKLTRFICVVPLPLNTQVFKKRGQLLGSHTRRSCLEGDFHPESSSVLPTR